MTSRGVHNDIHAFKNDLARLAHFEQILTRAVKNKTALKSSKLEINQNQQPRLKSASLMRYRSTTPYVTGPTSIKDPGHKQLQPKVSVEEVPIKIRKSSVAKARPPEKSKPRTQTTTSSTSLVDSNNYIKQTNLPLDVPTLLTDKSEKLTWSQRLPRSRASQELLSGPTSTTSVHDDMKFINREKHKNLPSTAFIEESSEINPPLSMFNDVKHKEISTLINPVRLLHFLFNELNAKLVTNVTDKDTCQILTEISQTLNCIPTDESNQSTKRRSRSPPMRDTDSESTIKLRQQIAVEKVNAETFGLLKDSLESMTLKVSDYSETIAELTKVTAELREENKKLHVGQLRANQLNEQHGRKCEKLESDVMLMKLEADNMVELLAEKDKENQRLQALVLQVKQDIVDVQQMISNQLTALKFRPIKSPSMENLQILSDDFDSVSTDVSGIGGQVRKYEGDRLPVTSSPTSSITSSAKGVYCASWQKISNISPGELVPIVNQKSQDKSLPTEPLLFQSLVHDIKSHRTEDPVILDQLANGLNHFFTDLKRQFNSEAPPGSAIAFDSELDDST